MANYKFDFYGPRKASQYIEEVAFQAPSFEEALELAVAYAEGAPLTRQSSGAVLDGWGVRGWGSAAIHHRGDLVRTVALIDYPN